MLRVVYLPKDPSRQFTGGDYRFTVELWRDEKGIRRIWHRTSAEFPYCGRTGAFVQKWCHECHHWDREAAECSLEPLEATDEEISRLRRDLGAAEVEEMIDAAGSFRVEVGPDGFLRVDTPKGTRYTWAPWAK